MSTEPYVEGVKVVSLKPHHDVRGSFQELYSPRSELAPFNVVQTNLSYSRKGVVRGLHATPFAKICTCLWGALFDVVADIRPGSPTYGKWVGYWLDDENKLQVYVPAGCAHGFFAETNHAALLYLQDGQYDPSQERTINWRDPTLSIEWPISSSYMLSEKDQSAPFLQVPDVA